jgi:hypothetical protein
MWGPLPSLALPQPREDIRIYRFKKEICMLTAGAGAGVSSDFGSSLFGSSSVYKNRQKIMSLRKRGLEYSRQVLGLQPLWILPPLVPLQ